MSLHIVTGSDDNYAAGVLVLIASAAFHTPGIAVTVLDNGISPANRQRIDALGARLGIEVARIEIDASHFAHLPVRRGHLTRSTYLRLLIPDVLPQLARVLYMDCDMVVTDDLSALADMQLGNAIVAAVPDPSPSAEELAVTGISEGEYFNAGLLVMNLPVWRAEGVADRCIALLSDPARPLLSEDQSALNIAAQGRMLALPKRFNVYADPAAYRSVRGLQRDPAVIHYVVNLKPWAARVCLGTIWDFHAARIADLMPPARPVTWKRRMSRWNTRRRVLLGLVARREKYRVRVAVEKAMSALARDYLSRNAGRADNVSGR